MDFLVVPTVTARLLYVLVVMNHERRNIVHFNFTDAPTTACQLACDCVSTMSSLPGS